MPDYPTSLDSLANPTSSTYTDDSGFELDAIIARAQDILEALEVKVGIGASTPTTAGDVLHVTGAGATTYGPRALVRLAEVTAGGSVSYIEFTNIPQTYRHLRIEMATRNSTSSTNIGMRVSTDGTTFDAGSNYDWQYTTASAATITSGESLATTAILAGAHGTASDVMSPATVDILDYANGSYQKTCLVQYGRKTGTATTDLGVIAATGFWRNTVAIKGVRLFPFADNFSTGSRVTLYGLPA
jgi:hypothetical protein